MISGPTRAPLNGGPPRRLVVILHGYGADGDDLIGLADHWAPLMPETLFTAPNAPQRCGQNPFGYEWFPLDFEDMAESVRTGVPPARAAIVAFLDDLWARTGLTAADTFLIGFSQGAMMALHTGLLLDAELLGIVSFAGALVPPATYAARPRICLVHGRLDQVVLPQRTEEAEVALTAAGLDISVHFSPDTPHGIAPDMLDFATAFMLDRVAAATG